MKRVIQFITMFLIINTSAMAKTFTAEGYAESCVGWRPDCFQDYYRAMERLRLNAIRQCYGDLALISGPTCESKITMPISSTTCTANYECHPFPEPCYEECIEIEQGRDYLNCHKEC